MIRSRFSLKPVKGLEFCKPSLVQAQFQKDTDINFLVRRYVAGDLSVIVRRPPITADCSDAPESLHQAFNIAKAAEAAWSTLPDSVRHTFRSYEAFLDSFEANAQAVFQNVQPSKATDDVTPDQGASQVTPGESAPVTT